jgi:hypothetical protein
MAQQQIQTPIIKSKRGRPRILPTVQCSVCLEGDANARYDKKANGDIYLTYTHYENIIGVRYYKNKTGKKVRQLEYKTCHAGLITAGLPMPNELAANSSPSPTLNMRKTKNNNLAETEKQKLISIRKSFEIALLRLRNAEGNDGQPFIRISYTRKP